MAKPLRVGVIGVGMGRNHIENYQQAAGCAVVAVADVDAARLLIEASWACSRSEPEVMETHLYGTKAGLVQKNAGGGYQFVAQTFEEHAGGQYDSELKPPLPPASSAMQHFVEAIRKGQPHGATGDEGLIVQQILDGL